MKSACFIVTYKRPNTVTPKTLREHGYSGEYFLVVSDNDPCIDEYKEKYGDKVLLFHKPDYAWMDYCDLDKSLDFGNIARYAAYDFAVEMGYDAWCMLDDDISDIKYRAYDENHSLKTYDVTKLDKIMDACFNAVINFPKGTIFAFFPAAMMFPGRINKFERFCSQFYFRDVKDGYDVKGRFHEDLNEVFRKNNIGELAFALHEMTFVGVVFDKKNGGNDGGMSSEYKNFNKYSRYFMALMNSPNSIRIKLGDKGDIDVEKILSNYVMILPERFKKQ